MLRTIHQGLVAQGIDAGPRAEVDAEIQGSPYFSYRCDAFNEPGPLPNTFKIMSSEEAQQLVENNPDLLAFNPAQHEDLYDLQGINAAPVSGCSLM